MIFHKIFKIWLSFDKKHRLWFCNPICPKGIYLSLFFSPSLLLSVLIFCFVLFWKCDKDKSIVNAGTTMGSLNQMLLYLRRMVWVMVRSSIPSFYTLPPTHEATYICWGNVIEKRGIATTDLYYAKTTTSQESLFLAPPEEGFSAVCEQGVHIYVAYKMPWHSAKVCSYQ